MPMDVRWGRLTAFVMLFVLPFVAGYTVLQTVAAVRQRRATGQWVQQQIDFIPKRTAYVSKLLQGGSWGVRQDGTEARLTPDDRATLQEELQRLTTAAGGSWGVRHSYFAAIAEALFLPFRSRSFGATSVPFYNRSNYPAPRSLRGSIGEKSRGVTVFVMGTSLVIWLVLPAGFVLLPISRRRARVRWGHVLRVALYSLVVLSLPGSASLLMLVIEPVAGSRWTSLLHVGHEAACVLMIPLLIGWWAAAVRRYLHISNGWAVALAFAAVGILLAALIGVTLNGV